MKCKVTGHIRGCTGTTCIAQSLELTSTDGSDEGSLFYYPYTVYGRTKQHLSRAVASNCSQKVLQLSASNKLKSLFFFLGTVW